MARVGADDADDALALDDLALRANGFDAGSNFHSGAFEVIDEIKVGQEWTMRG